MAGLSSVATIHRALAAAFLALALVEFFFAGLVAFDQTTSHAHADLGSALMAVAAVLAILAVVDRPEAREASIALTFAMLVEVLLGVFADDARPAALEDPALLLVGQRTRRLDVEARLDPGRGDVGVLAAGAGGAARAQLHLGQRDGHPARDDQPVLHPRRRS